VTYCARKGIVLRGVVFFPQRVTGTFAYDDTAPAVAAALPNFIAKLTGGRLAPSPLPAPAPAAAPPDLGPITKSIDGLRLQVIDGQRNTEQQLDAILEAARATTRPTSQPTR
jgi:hypothetical protein